MNQSFVPSIFGLCSAIVWGAADFCGGLASRRSPVLSVLILAELSGFVVLLLLAFVFGEEVPVAAAAAWSVAAGVSGTIGLGSLYRGLAIGPANMVAPISAVVGATLPAIFTAFTTGLPGELRLIGFGLALASIVLASQSSREATSANALPFALLAGLGFGGFFILIHQASSEHSTFFPLAIARVFPIPIMIAISLWRKASIFPGRAMLSLVLLTGILDATGTVFFLISSNLGRLDVATILSSLFPASTVILSAVILHEKLVLRQKLGVLLALTAIALIVW